MSPTMIMFTVHFRLPQNLLGERLGGVSLDSTLYFRPSVMFDTCPTLGYFLWPPRHPAGTSSRTNTAIVVACPARPCCKLLPPLFFIFPRTFSILPFFFVCFIIFPPLLPFIFGGVPVLGDEGL